MGLPSSSRLTATEAIWNLSESPAFARESGTFPPPSHHSYLQILPTIVFLLSVSSLHICSLSYMVIVLIPYTSSAYGKEVHPVGKSYASIVDDEKTAFEQRSKHRQNGHKKPATSIVAAFADMGG